MYSLTEFNSIKKKSDETVVKFIRRFNKLYNSLLVKIKPPPVGAKITLVNRGRPLEGFKSDGNRVVNKNEV